MTLSTGERSFDIFYLAKIEGRRDVSRPAREQVFERRVLVHRCVGSGERPCRSIARGCVLDDSPATGQEIFLFSFSRISRGSSVMSARAVPMISAGRIANPARSAVRRAVTNECTVISREMVYAN